MVKSKRYRYRQIITALIYFPTMFEVPYILMKDPAPRFNARSGINPTSKSISELSPNLHHDEWSVWLFACIESFAALKMGQIS